MLDFTQGWSWFVAGLGTTLSFAILVVLGSRGLHGFSARGSVGERAGHRATCSVLVVR